MRHSPRLVLLLSLMCSALLLLAGLPLTNHPLVSVQGASAQGGTCGLWGGSAQPAVESALDPASVEVGVRFRSSVDGFITGICFYKGGGNTGAHRGNLWSDAGTRLATAAFVGGTASGWQTVHFAYPISIKANQVYVASYHTSGGGYAYTHRYFSTGQTRGSLHALADAEGGNGVFSYGPVGFPRESFRATNYWVDVMFTSPFDAAAPAAPTATPTPTLGPLSGPPGSAPTPFPPPSIPDGTPGSGDGGAPPGSGDGGAPPVGTPPGNGDGGTPPVGTPPGSGDGGTPPIGTPPGSGDGETPPVGTPPGSGDGGTPPVGTPPGSGDGGTPPGSGDGGAPPVGTPPGNGDGGTPPIGTPPGSGDGGTPPVGTPPGNGDGGTPPVGTPPGSGDGGTPPIGMSPGIGNGLAPLLGSAPGGDIQSLSTVATMQQGAGTGQADRLGQSPARTAVPTATPGASAGAAPQASLVSGTAAGDESALVLPAVPGEAWLLIREPVQTYSVEMDPLWVALPGELYRVMTEETGWALAVPAGYGAFWSVWIEFDPVRVERLFLNASEPLESAWLWLEVFAPTPIYSLADDAIDVADEGDWYLVVGIEDDWALAVYEGDLDYHVVVWIPLIEGVQLSAVL